MGKRKRNAVHGVHDLPLPAGGAKKTKVVHQGGATPVTFQIVIGTYEKVLHGITASVKNQATELPETDRVEFADTFLLNAHTSAIRCLAVRMFPSSLRYQVLVRETSFEKWRILAWLARVSQLGISNSKRC